MQQSFNLNNLKIIQDNESFNINIVKKKRNNAKGKNKCSRKKKCNAPGFYKHGKIQNLPTCLVQNPIVDNFTNFFKVKPRETARK